MSDNYPDDIRKYDNDPRSPFYDDDSEQNYCEERYDELIEDISEIDCLDTEILGEIVIDWWNEPNCSNKSIMIAKLARCIESAADKQSDLDWKKFAGVGSDK